MMDFSIDDVAAKIRVGPFSIEIKRKADKTTPDTNTDELLRKRKEAQDMIDQIDRELKEQDDDRTG